MFHRSFLIAKINLSQSVPLTVTISPFEVVHQAPRMKRAHIRTIGSRTRQLCQNSFEELCTPLVQKFPTIHLEVS
jgi:hypothetical protein